jgi:hypothetical protein
MSFATGFFGTLARGMEDKRSFIRDRIEEERSYLREQGLQRQSQVSELRNNYRTAADMVIRRLGGGEDARSMVRTALEQDPEGLMQMAQYAQDPDVSSATLRSGFNISQEYTDKSMEEILGTIAPVTRDLGPDANPAEVENRSFAAMLGLDTESALRDEVYSSEIVGGMTGDDILAARGTPVRTRGTAGSEAGLYNFDVFGQGEQMDTRDAALVQGQVVLSYERKLDNERERLATLFDNEELSDAQRQDINEAMREIDQLKEIRDADDVEFLRRMSEMYGPTNTLLRAQQQYGSEFMNNVTLFPNNFSSTLEREPRNPFTFDWEEATETQTTEREPSTSSPETGGEETEREPRAPTPASGNARILESEEVLEENLSEPEELSGEETEEAMSLAEEAFGIAGSLPEVVIETSTGKQVRVENPEPTRSLVDRGLDPSLVVSPEKIRESAERERMTNDEDTVMSQPLSTPERSARERISFEEWQKLSRKERRERNLPETTFQWQNQ